MKILLSAYACEPNHGSEPGVGWNWAVELAQLGHDVWVLTRESNKSSIETYFSNTKQSENLNFLFYDLPLWARWWKKGGRGIHFYYFLWQMGAYRIAKRAHHKLNFDRVHHVTFVSVRQPSFMWMLGIPFIFGPVAGGESAPWCLRMGYGPRGMILDAIRDVLNFMVKLDPFMYFTFHHADRIYVTSEQTKKLLPSRFQQKAIIQLAIGSEVNVRNKYIEAVEKTKNFRILYVGHFLYLKGMHLGLVAFAKLLKKIPNATLTLVGEGPEEKRWKNLTVKLGIEEKVHWVSWLEQKKLLGVFMQHDVFFFPSLHDSGGMVVLEAMAHGLPVVCLQLGGPGIIVDGTCGEVIEVNRLSKKQVCQSLCDSLEKIASNKELHSNLKEGALIRSNEYRWNRVVRKIYE